MQIQRQTTINTSPEQVWNVLAHQFDQVDRWASSVFRSTARKDAPAPTGAATSGRTCETELGPFKESIIEFDEKRMILAYEASGEKMPFFVKGMRNRWSLTQVAKEATRVDMLMTADLAFPFNLFMAPLMKLQMGKILTFATQELKHYVETGKPHPRKVTADAQAQQQAA